MAMPVDRIWEAAKHDRGITCTLLTIVISMSRLWGVNSGRRTRMERTLVLEWLSAMLAVEDWHCLRPKVFCVRAEGYNFYRGKCRRRQRRCRRRAEHRWMCCAFLVLWISASYLFSQTVRLNSRVSSDWFENARHCLAPVQHTRA